MEFDVQTEHRSTRTVENAVISLCIPASLVLQKKLLISKRPSIQSLERTLGEAGQEELPQTLTSFREQCLVDGRPKSSFEETGDGVCATRQFAEATRGCFEVSRERRRVLAAPYLTSGAEQPEGTRNLPRAIDERYGGKEIVYAREHVIGFGTRPKRRREFSTYFCSVSNESHRRCRRSAMAPDVLLPANGSTTRSLGRVKSLM